MTYIVLVGDRCRSPDGHDVLVVVLLAMNKDSFFFFVFLRRRMSRWRMWSGDEAKVDGVRGEVEIGT